MSAFLPRLLVLLAGSSLIATTVWAQKLPPTHGPIPQKSAAPAASASTSTFAPASASTLDSSVQVTKRASGAAVDPDIAQGYQSLKEGHWLMAREAYARSLRRQPMQRDALLGMAYTYHALGQMDLAKTVVRRLLDLYPRDEQSVSAFYLVGGDALDQAENHLKQLLNVNNQSALLHFTLGVIYSDQGRLPQAQEHFGLALALQPQQADYAYNLALTLDQLNQTTEAAVQYAAALDLAKQTSAVFNRPKAQERLHVLLSHP